MKISPWGRASLSLVAVLALAGCGDVLDWRNAEVSQGKVFRRGADTPFSGKVTGIPDHLIVHANRDFIPMLEPINFMRATSGLVQTGGSICTGKFKKGVVDGTVQCSNARTGHLQVEMEFDEGRPDGSYTLYDATENKNKIVTAKYKDGRVDGLQVIYSPQSQKKVFEAHWERGAREGDVIYFNPETGSRVDVRPFKNNQLDGAAVIYTADGKQVTQRVVWKAGVRDGLEERFSENGKKLFEVQWINNGKHGDQKQWDENGTLIHHTVYERGNYVTDKLASAQSMPAPNSGACVDKWLAAHRKEVGPDAPVRVEQLDEWEAWCRAGKQPT